MVKPLHFFGPNPQSTKGAQQVFDYSRMEGRFFEPDDKICIIIDNADYGNLRKLEEFNKSHMFFSNALQFDDMPDTRIWADEFQEGIAAYFSPE